jgi:DNA-binding PadR family transcriptional regulator
LETVEWETDRYVQAESDYSFALMGGTEARRERSLPMRSAVNWTVLGLVIERSSYGFELWKRYEREYGDMAPTVGGSNIYAALNVLKDKGLIEERVETRRAPDGAARLRKSHYRATQEGLVAYEGWAIAQAREHDRRSRQFARQLGAFERQPQIALAILERYGRACLDDKDARIPTTVKFPTPVTPGLGDQLASAYGREVKAATLGWIEYARRKFEALASKETPLP